MDWGLIVEYGWVLLVLIGLEGILAADNALVLAIMVKHLPEAERKKALFYGLMGAFIFRFASLFFVSYVIDFWQFQAIGAAYLLFICLNHIFRKLVKAKFDNKSDEEKEGKTSGFWWTVFKVELADVAFAVDAILAAFALATTLPKTGLGSIGSLDYGQFGVIFAGGIIGIVIMRFAANKFVGLLERYPQLETGAFLIVGWVGVKLLLLTLSHPDIDIISYSFVHSIAWKVIFWVVLLGIAGGSFYLGKMKEKKNEAA
ncbi:MAG: TerC family protein [Bacilli bacterium]